MRRLAGRRYVFPLVVLLVFAGVSVGLVVGVRRLGGESTPEPCINVPASVAHVSDLEKYVPFTLYGPTGLPATDAELQTRQEVDSPGTYVTIRYRHPASGSLVTVSQTTDGMYESEDMVPLEVDGKRVRFLREQIQGHFEIGRLLWEQGDVLINVGVTLEGGMTESDIWPIIASFAPVSSQADTGDPLPCTCRMIGPLSTVQKGAPFTLYAPTYLPAGFVEISSGLETDPTTTQDSARPVTRVNTSYRHPSSQTLVFVYQTDARITMDDRGRYERVQLDERTVWLERGETFGRPEILAVQWFEGDVHVQVSVMLKGGTSESDFWAIVASVAPTSS